MAATSEHESRTNKKATPQSTGHGDAFAPDNPSDSVWPHAAAMAHANTADAGQSTRGEKWVMGDPRDLTLGER